MSFRNISVVLTANTSSLRTQLITAAGQVDRFGKSVNATNTKMVASGTAAKAMGLGVVAIGLGMLVATQQAAKFEREMRNVNAISHLSEAALKALSEQVLELSKSMPQSPTDLAKGLYFVASAGFHGADGLAVLKASAEAATAGLTDTDAAAKAISITLRAYNLPVSEATRVSDALFQTVKYGLTTFDELAKNIGDVVGVASIAGISIEQVGTAMSAMTIAGIPAAESATALQRVIRSIINPSTALRLEMSKLGLNLQSLANPAGLSDFFAKLQTDLHGSIETLQEWFPNIRAFRGAAALMSGAGRTYVRVASQMGDANKTAGATQAAFNQQMKATTAQFRLFRNAVDVALIHLGQRLLPVLNQLMDGLQRLGPTLAKASHALGPLFTVIRNIGVNLAHIAEMMIADFGPELAAAAGLAIQALTGLGKVVESLTGFLSHNRNVVRALAILFSGLFLTSMARMAAVLGATVMQTRILGPLLSGLGGIVTAAAQAVRLFVGEFLAATQINMAAGFNMAAAAALSAKDALLGFITSGAGITAVAVALGFTLVSAIRNANRAGKEFATTMEADFNPHKWSTYAKTTNEMADALAKLYQQRQGQRNAGGFLRAYADLMIPFQNFGDTMIDIDGKIDALNPKFKDLQMQMFHVQDAAVKLGLSSSTVLKFLDLLDLDPSALGSDWTGTIQALQDAKIAAQASSTELDTLAAAFGTVSDETTNGTEKLKAYGEALDATVNQVLGMFNAETGWAQSLRDVDSALRINGATTNAYTDTGQKNRSVLAAMAAAALDRAKAAAVENESISAGNEVLNESVEAFKEVARQAGLTEPEIAGLVEQLGLTPDNLQVLVGLESPESAQKGLKDIKDKMKDLAAEVAKPKVKLQGAGEVKRQIDELDRYLTNFEKKHPGVTRFGTQIGAGPPKQPTGRTSGGTVDRSGHISMRAGGGSVWPNMTYLVGERGPELVQFRGTGRVIPAHDARSRAAASGGSLRPMAWGGNFGSWAPNPFGHSTSTPRGEAASVRAGRSETQDNPYLKALDDENKGIAKNRQEWELSHMTIQQRIATLDRLIPKERMWSDEWVALMREREQAEDELKQAQEAVSNYLQALFDRRVEIAKNMYAEHKTSAQEYINLLDEQLSHEVAYTDTWMALMQERRRVAKSLANDEAIKRLTAPVAPKDPALEQWRREGAAAGNNWTANAAGTGQVVLVPQTVVKQYSFQDVIAANDIYQIAKEAEALERKKALTTTGMGGTW